MNRQMTCGTSSISFQNPVFVQSCASVVSRKEGEGPLGAYFDLTAYVKILCLEQIPGKLQKALCKNRPLCWQSKKTASPVPIYSFFLQATCWLRHQPLLSEPLI